MGLLAWHARNRQQRADLPDSILKVLFDHTDERNNFFTWGEILAHLLSDNFWKGYLGYPLLYTTLAKLSEEEKIHRIWLGGEWYYSLNHVYPESLFSTKPSTASRRG